ncbi:hypothetical protein SEPCBS119000_006150 [Sporothrix epigloea]|uniref:DUF1941 family protein n=1 Tax=Sporothrix epigloea TaxID=1892477 RepID=A0ABP0E1E7_9PEZI
MSSQAEADETALVDAKPSSVAQNDGVSATTSNALQEASISRIQLLLRAKDDTSRFVALALLKAVLDDQAKDGGGDNQGEGKVKLKASFSEEGLLRLWEALPIKFLDKLLRAGQGSCLSSSSVPTSTTITPNGGDAAHMRDIAVAALHRFTTLATLVSHATGAAVLNLDVTDLRPLIELAPEQPLSMNVLLNAWLHGLLADHATTAKVTTTIKKSLPALAAAFKGTDGVTLLDFIAKLLRNAEAIAEKRHIPLPKADPAWMRPVASFVQQLAVKRPTAVARSAYTHAVAALLRAYPVESSKLLWGEDRDVKSDTPFAYLLVSMLLVDLRTTLPGLLAQLNDSAYADTAARLASAFDILSAFIGYLVRTLEDNDMKLSLSSDDLLRLRKSMTETLSVTIEYLRDRWDAAVAGAHGLQPNARSPTAEDYRFFSSSLDAAGLPLAWESVADVVDRDSLVLASLRTLALWLREDDNETLRREAAGLIDMLLGLYVTSAEDGNLDYRRPVLVALEGICSVESGSIGDGDDDTDTAYETSTVTILLENGAWKILTKDLLASLHGASPGTDLTAAAARGIEIVRVLLPIVENERPGTREEWMDFVTLMAAWPGPEDEDKVFREAASISAECRVAALQLVTALVVNAHPSICRRYTHSISAVVGLARRLRPTLAAAKIGAGQSVSLAEALLDVQSALESIRA